MDSPHRLSPSEKQTLKQFSAGEYESIMLDWIALHRLKRLGFIEPQSTGRGMKITKEGMRALKGSEVSS